MEIDTFIDIEVEGIYETGPQGLSAYEVYQKNGGKLSEEKWLESLKGEKGEPGKDGMDGIDGIDGKDAPTYIAGENITIDENNVISASVGDDFASLPNGIYQLYSETTYSDLYTSARSDNSEEMLAKVSNIINDAFNKGFITGILFSNNNSSSYYKLYSPRYLLSITSKPTLMTFYATATSFYSTNMDYALQVREPNLIIKGTWDGDVFTATAFSYGNVGTLYMDCWTKSGLEKYYLKKTNKTEFTPTEDYNPATKKYVDDSIANNGAYDPEIRVIKLPFNLDMSKTGHYTKAVEDTEWISDMNELLTEVSNCGDTSKYLVLIKDLEGKHYGFGLFKYLPSDFTGTYGFAIESTISKSIRDNIISNPTLYIHDFVFYAYVENGVIDMSMDKIDKTYNVSLTPQTLNSRGIYSTTGQPLGVKNTTSFTPTKDYHPATKKYVDDSIASAITTVLEGEY